MTDLSDEQYHVLLVFRCALRRYLRWSADEAGRLGLTANQHQALLAVRGHQGPNPPSIRELAGYLMIRHHSAVELVRRMETLGVLTRSSDPHDHRVVRLALTEHGEELLSRLATTHMAELQRVVARLGITEDLLSRLSTEFVSHLDLDVHYPESSG